MLIPTSPFCILTSDRKSTRLNSSLVEISYAVFCLKKKNSTGLVLHARQNGGEARHRYSSRGPRIIGRHHTPRISSRALTATRRCSLRFFFNDPPTTKIYTLSLHDALPICAPSPRPSHSSSPNQTASAKAAETTPAARSEEHTSELQSRRDLVCRLLLDKKKKKHGEQLARISMNKQQYT